MNINNIKGIIESEVWKRIIKSKDYRGHHIIDADNKPEKQRTSGQFFVLLIFFGRDISKERVLEYRKECFKVPKREGHESLDTPDIHEFYGTLKMLRIS